jgi:hypothetical protein
MRWSVALLVVTGCVAKDTTPPDLVLLTPETDTDLRGVGLLTVRVGLQEDNGGTGQIDLDGTALGDAQAFERCDQGCTLEWEAIDVAHVPAGIHHLHVHLEDRGGNATDRTHDVLLDDVLTVEAMEVTNTVDDVPPLEIEVYVIDDGTGTLLGCAGSRQGLGPVDVSDVRYDHLGATLIDPRMTPMAAAELGGGPVHFEVWEDDDPPVCPTPVDPMLNDLVGKSAGMTFDAWHAATTITFGNVTELSFAFDRPFAN